MSSQQEGPRTKGKRPSIAIVLASLVLVIVLVSAAVVYAAMDVEWRIGRVRDGDASWPFVAVDGSGSLHMTYTVDDSLIYSSLTEDGWEESVIVTGAVSGTSPLVFDGSGNPHVCYQLEDRDNETGPLVFSLTYAELVGEEWTSSVISETIYPDSESIAVDTEGTVHVAFVSMGDVVYVNDRDGSWEETLLIEHPDAPEYILMVNSGATSVAVDQSSNIHVAVAYNRGYVGVFSDEGSGWTEHTLFAWDLTYDSVSLVARDDGVLQVAYYGYPLSSPSLMGLMTGTRMMDVWQVEPVAGVASSPNDFTCALTMDEDCNPLIAWRESGPDGSNIRVSTQVEGTWQSPIVVGNEELVTYHCGLFSACLDADGSTFVPVDRGAAEYVTDSMSFSDRISSVRLLAIMAYAGGLLLWAAAVLVSRWALNREPKKKQV